MTNEGVEACGRCGKPVQSRAVACRHCGARFVPPEVPLEVVRVKRKPEPAPAPEPPPPPPREPWPVPTWQPATAKESMPFQPHDIHPAWAVVAGSGLLAAICAGGKSWEAFYVFGAIAGLALGWLLLRPAILSALAEAKRREKE